MPFETMVENNIPVLKPAGRFDAYEVPKLDDWLETERGNHREIIVDLQEVKFIDTRALSVLVKWMKKLRESGGDLRLVNLSNPVRVIFELSRLDKAFSIYTTMTDALADAQSSDSVASSTASAPDTEVANVDAGDVQVIALDGRIDAFRLPDLQSQHEQITDGDAPQIVADLSHVTFLDSAGLAWLVKLLKQAQSNGGQLVLVRSQIDVANRIFQLTQFDKVFKFTDSRDDAIKLLKG